MQTYLQSLLLHRRFRWAVWALLSLLLLLAGLTAARLAGSQELAQAIPSPTPQGENAADPPVQAVTPTATPTGAGPTPTWTTFPTATPTATRPTTKTPTPIAESPLGFVAAQTPIAYAMTPAPLPPWLMVPRVAPVSPTPPPSPTVETAVPDSVSLLPTPTPALPRPEEPAPAAGIEGETGAETAPVAPSLPITEALQQPVTAGSMPTDPAPPEPVPAEATPVPPPPEPTAAVAPTPDGSARTVRVPILMYHYLSVPPPGADRYRVDLSVAPDTFAAHLDAMQQAGYTTISFYALLAHLNQGAPLPEKPVIISFDDGYRDNYENAFPLLRERGMTATFFVVTDFIDGQRPEYLTWDMVREMYAGGMSVESHGRNHVSLKNKDRDYLIWQALGSSETIQFELGVRPHFVSYPAGEYDDLTITVFREAGYWAGMTTAQGATHRSDDLFRMQRVRVRNSTTAGELLRLLALDW